MPGLDRKEGESAVLVHHPPGEGVGPGLLPGQAAGEWQ